jgi:hypothetical protein
MTARERLPDRRVSESFTFELDLLAASRSEVAS